MRCETTADAETFWEATHVWLESDPVLNSVILTNVKSRRGGVVSDSVPPVWAIVRDGEEIVGVAMRTPPRHAYISRMPPAAIISLAEMLLKVSPDNDGVSGTAAEAQAFADHWSSRTGCSVVVSMEQRIFQLESVTPARPVSGTLRLAEAADRDLLIEWEDAFFAEADPAAPPPSDRAQVVDARINDGRAALWSTAGDGPVAYTAFTPDIAGVVRVGPVYTPPRFRSNGYASALVASVSQRALDHGATHCSLYTDLANPTSNKIYAALGYRPVADVRALRFSRP